MNLTLKEVAAFAHATGTFNPDAEACGYSIDSRTVQPGELFFAVRGDNFDGHSFVAAALARGAVAAVVSHQWPAPETVDAASLLRVDDPLAALQAVAHGVRKQWGKLLIGITGSAGKTTTKEAVAHVLSAKFNVLKSEGNLNNGFGLPLQLLKLQPEHEIAVIEMGMNHAGEIAALATIAAPDWAVVSNVAPVHLEHFADGIEGIARAKYELVQALPSTGRAILNADDPHVAAFARGMADHAIFYGLSETAQVRATAVKEQGINGMAFTVHARGQQLPAATKLLGQHNVYNFLAAIAVGLEAGMTLDHCVQAAAEIQPAYKRGEIVEWRGATIINDSYNSNPRALDAMVDALLAVKAKRHIVIAGEMLELGPDGPALHAACGTHMAERGIRSVIGVRGLAADLVLAAERAGADALFLATPAEAGAWMVEHLRPGDAVLLKASRGVRLEAALDLLTPH